MIKVVLDTNILVSGTFWTGNSFKIMELIDKREITSILSEDIVKEYHKTINSDEIIDKIKDKNLIISNVSRKVVLNSIIIQPKEKLDVIKNDPDDNKILECAYAGKAGYIVTKDNHLLKLKEFKNIKIVTPEEFLKLFK
ncbi:MAG: putative toxin-antitoxin system toxin component, PIN family [Nanoarchaeota archaeon]